MSSVSLMIAASISAAVALVYAYVGKSMLFRDAEPRLRFARNMFAAWWFFLAASSMLSALQHSAAAAGIRDMAFFSSILHANLIVIPASLWALLYYLIFLYTGSNKHFVPLTLFYAGYHLLLTYYVEASRPEALEVGRWSVRVVYEQPMPTSFFLLVLALLVLPQILASVAYGTLFFRIRNREQRYRIVLVSTSLFVWFASAFAAVLAGISGRDVWQLGSRFIGLTAAIVILIAYRPPGFIHRWLVAPGRGATGSMQPR